MENRDGHELFREFLALVEANDSEAARAIGVSRALVSLWKGGRRPGAAIRIAIDKWSRGRVPADSWLQQEDRDNIARVKPVSLARVRKGLLKQSIAAIDPVNTKPEFCLMASSSCAPLNLSDAQCGS
jgi:hypothetical protein